MKRHIALVLAVLITLTSFSGCGMLIRNGKEAIFGNENGYHEDDVTSRQDEFEWSTPEISDEANQNGAEVYIDPDESEQESDETPELEVQNRYENLIDGMSKSERKKINIFLSNFSEAGFWYYDRYEYVDYYELIKFAYFHNEINTGKVKYTEDEVGIAGETAAATVKKYLGVTLPLKTTYDGYGGVWEYKDGWFWTEPETTGLHVCFSVAYDMVDNGDGTYTVYYDVFSVDDADKTPEKCYEYTVSEARKKYSYECSGDAVVKEKTYNGDKTYELISYKPD